MGNNYGVNWKYVFNIFKMLYPLSDSQHTCRPLYMHVEFVREYDMEISSLTRNSVTTNGQNVSWPDVFVH